VTFRPVQTASCCSGFFWRIRVPERVFFPDRSPEFCYSSQFCSEIDGKEFEPKVCMKTSRVDTDSNRVRPRRCRYNTTKEPQGGRLFIFLIASTICTWCRSRRNAPSRRYTSFRGAQMYEEIGIAGDGRRAVGAVGVLGPSKYPNQLGQVKYSHQFQYVGRVNSLISRYIDPKPSRSAGPAARTIGNVRPLHLPSHPRPSPRILQAFMGPMGEGYVHRRVFTA
jgi:hypothetical protein